MQVTHLRKEKYIFCFVMLDHDADVGDQKVSDEGVNMLKEYPGFTITSSFEVLETKMWKVNCIYRYIFSRHMYNTFHCCLKVMLPSSELLRKRLNT